MSANPKACSGLEGLRFSGKEEVMWEKLEDEILHIREGSACDACGESEEDTVREEESGEDVSPEKSDEESDEESDNEFLRGGEAEDGMEES